MIDPDVELGAGVVIFDRQLVNIFGCSIGDGTFIGPFVEITRGVKIGRRCKIESHSFVCDGVELADGVFIGHGVMFTNDLYPTTYRQVKRLSTFVGEGTSLGSNATVLGGIRIGSHVVIGAGAVVTTHVPDFSIAVGNPARVVRTFTNAEEVKAYIESQQQGAGPADAACSNKVISEKS
jgi:UDP-2-acetamido-3-amino-2,3-dideoxy-glucuronate N-acetyltransferase